MIFITTLPRIEHPSKRFHHEEKYSLDIRGKSTDQSISHLSTHSHGEEIPDNIPFVYGENRNKVRLPIFGKSLERIR